MKSTKDRVEGYNGLLCWAEAIWFDYISHSSANPFRMKTILTKPLQLQIPKELYMFYWTKELAAQVHS